MSDPGPILCICDLHGQPSLLKKALAQSVVVSGRDDLTCVLLGDYVDNGPKVPELLDYLSSGAMHAEWPRMKFECILGNHDLALLLSVHPGLYNTSTARSRGKTWWERWTGTFHNPGGATQLQFGAKTQSEFQEKFPKRELAWLMEQPFVRTIDQYCFVHACLQPSDMSPATNQIAFLRSKDFSDLSNHKYRGGNYGMPDQVSNKDWDELSDPAWGFVVVTGHNKYMYYVPLHPQSADKIDGVENLSTFLKQARQDLTTKVHDTHIQIDNKILHDPCSLVYAGIEATDFMNKVMPTWNALLSGRRVGLTRTEFVSVLQESVVGRFSAFPVKRLVHALERLYHACDAMGDDCVTWEGFTTYLMDSSRAVTCTLISGFHFLRSSNINGNFNEDMMCTKMYPCNPAQWVVATTDAGKIHILDVSTEHIKFHQTIHTDMPVLSVEVVWARRPFDPVPKGAHFFRNLLITSSADMRVRVYEITTVERIITLRYERIQHESITAVRYSALDDMLFTGSRTGEVCVWAISWTGELTPLRTTRCHTDAVIDIAVMVRWRFASASLDMNVVQYDMLHNDNDEIDSIRAMVFSGHTKGLHTLVYVAEHKLMVSAGYESMALCWIESQPQIEPFRLEDPKEPHKGHIVKIVAVADSKHQVLSLDNHGMIKSWDVSTFLPERSFFGAPEVQRKDVADVRIVSACYIAGTKCVLVNTTQRAYLFESDSVVPGSANLAANYMFPIVLTKFLQNNHRILTVSERGFKLWDTTNGSFRADFRALFPSVVMCADVDRSGRRLVCAMADGRVIVVRVDTGTILRTYSVELPGVDYLCAHYISDTRFLVTSEQGNLLIFDDVDTGQVTAMPLRCIKRSKAGCIAYCWNLSLIAFADGQTIQFMVHEPHDVTVRQIFRTPPQKSEILTLCELHPYPAVAAADTEGVISIWSTRPYLRGFIVLARWRNCPTEGDAVTPCAVSALAWLHPYTLITGDDGGSITIWDISNVVMTYRLVVSAFAKLTLSVLNQKTQCDEVVVRVCSHWAAHNDAVTSIQFLPPCHIVTTASDNTVLLWRLSSRDHEGPQLCGAFQLGLDKKFQGYLSAPTRGMSHSFKSSARWQKIKKFLITGLRMARTLGGKGVLDHSVTKCTLTHNGCPLSNVELNSVLRVNWDVFKFHQDVRTAKRPIAQAIAESKLLTLDELTLSLHLDIDGLTTFGASLHSPKGLITASEDHSPARTPALWEAKKLWETKPPRMIPKVVFRAPVLERTVSHYHTLKTAVPKEQQPKYFPHPQQERKNTTVPPTMQSLPQHHVPFERYENNNSHVWNTDALRPASYRLPPRPASALSSVSCQIDPKSVTITTTSYGPSIPSAFVRRRASEGLSSILHRHDVEQRESLRNSTIQTTSLKRGSSKKKIWQ